MNSNLENEKKFLETQINNKDKQITMIKDLKNDYENDKFSRLIKNLEKQLYE